MNCLDYPCIICGLKWGNHSKMKSKNCSDILYIYYKAMEILSKESYKSTEKLKQTEVND